MSQTDMKQNFDNTSLIIVALKYKWHILAAVIVAALLGVIFSSSFFITPMYKSETVAYPSNISTYSNENETEQMLQIIGSQAVKDSIVEKYDLWSHYKISRNYKYAKSKMMYKYGQNVKITKTPYDAISVLVLDKSPDTAALIAKDILVIYNNVVFEQYKQKYEETSDMLRRQMVRKQHDIDSMKSRLANLSQQYGLLDYRAQSREVVRSYLSGSSEANELKKNMELYGAEMLELEEKIVFETENFSDLKKDYETEYRYTVSPRTYYTLVTEPYPDDHKAYPCRLVIVTLCALGAFVISLLVASMVERRNRK